MNIDKTTRHKIYVKALELFNGVHAYSESMNVGMCWCMTRAIREYINIHYINDYAECFPELYEFKPKIGSERYNNTYWFTTSGLDSLTLRREVLEYCIDITKHKSEAINDNQL